MRPIKCRIKWNKHLLNPPHLEVLVDEMPEEFVYRSHKTKEGTLWFAESQGLVRFYIETPNKRGFGGREYVIETEDGPHKMVGPWSSRAGVMNIFFSPQSVGVSLTADPEAFERGYTFYSAHISLEKAREAVSLLDESIKLTKVVKWGGEIYYEVEEV